VDGRARTVWTPSSATCRWKHEGSPPPLGRSSTGNQRLCRRARPSWLPLTASTMGYDGGGYAWLQECGDSFPHPP
jgi:hypothetical protein